MKSIITFLLFVLAIGETFSQVQNLRINPNQSINKQYIPISVNGRELLSNTRKPLNDYETKGYYNSYLLTDLYQAFADKYSAENTVPTLQEVLTSGSILTESHAINLEDNSLSISTTGLSFGINLESTSSPAAYFTTNADVPVIHLFAFPTLGNTRHTMLNITRSADV